MSFRGLDLSPYISKFSDQIEEGYKARQAQQMQQAQMQKQMLFAQNLPADILSDDTAFKQTYANALQNNMPDVANTLLGKRMDMQVKMAETQAKRGNAMPMEQAKAIYPGITDSEYQAVKLLPDSEHQVNQLNSMRESSLKQQELGLKRRDFDSSRSDKLAKDMSSHLDLTVGRAGLGGKIQQKIFAAQNIDAIFNQFPDFNIPKSQTVDLATAIAGLISGGSPQSQQQINEIMSRTGKSDAASLAQYVTGEPTGLKQQNIMRVLKESSDREKAVAQGQVNEILEKRLPSHQELKKLNPSVYNSIKQSHVDKLVGGFESTTPTPPLPNWINLIKDQNVKAEVMGQIKSAPVDSWSTARDELQKAGHLPKGDLK